MPTDNGNHGDSAGQPWAGRSFEPNPNANDDGSADAAVIAAIEAFRSLPLTDPARAEAQSAVIATIGRSRLLMPLVAEAGDHGVGPNGLVVDKTQELALVTVAGPVGQKVLPAFTSVTAMSRWREDARPVPVEARRAALAAVLEEVNWIVVDPVSPTEFVIRRPAVAAMAKGEPWVPAHADPELQAAFHQGAAADPYVREIRLVAGDADARGMSEDLIAQLVLIPGLAQDDVTRTLQALSRAWSDEPLFAERIDAMKIQIVPGA